MFASYENSLESMLEDPDNVPRLDIDHDDDQDSYVIDLNDADDLSGSDHYLDETLDRHIDALTDKYLDDDHQNDRKGKRGKTPPKPVQPTTAYPSPILKRKTRNMRRVEDSQTKPELGKRGKPAKNEERPEIKRQPTRKKK